MPEAIFLRMPEMEKARFKHWVQSLNTETQTEVKKIVATTLNSIARKAIMSAPVNKKVGYGGFLKQSIRTTRTSDGLGGTVYTGRLYAPYMEWGTGDYVKVDEDLRDYAMTFKGKGIRKVNIKPRPYLFPAVRIGLKEMRLKLESLGFKLKE